MSDCLVLGMDGGGTGTTCWLADESGRVVGRAESGPSNVKSVGATVARTSLNAAIEGAFESAGLSVQPVAVACLGLAGFDREEDRVLLRDWSDQASWARSLVLTNDCELVVAAGTPSGVGVGVIAGTGSIAMGIAADGRRVRAGGWGHIFGDEGSGYAVAVAALRRIARLTDGRDPRSAEHDALARHVCRFMEIEHPVGLVSAVYGRGYDRAWIAGMVPAVVAAADEDRAIVDEILTPAGRDLADIIAAVAHRLGWNGGPLDVGMGGGLILNCVAVQQGMIDGLESRGFHVNTRGVEHPVEGALVLARRALNSPR